MLVEIIVAILIFLVGYGLGRIKKIERGLLRLGNGDPIDDKQRTFFGIKSRKNKSNKKIDIDESKVVVDVPTDDFKKSFKELGTKSTSDDDLTSSVSKLSQLKKKKK